MGARHVCLLLALTACSDGEAPRTAPTPSVAPAPQSAPQSPLVGRFEGESLCLVLLANGDVELILNRRPKLLVLGRGERDGETLRFEVQRIWSARYLSRCREHHVTGHWEERTRALGVDLEVGSTVALRVEAVSDQQIRLCAEEACETLTRAPPRLPSAWEDGRRLPERADLDPGTPIRLETGENAHVAYALDGGGVGHAHGEATVSPTAEGFLVTFVPARVDEPTPTVLGSPLIVGAERRFAVRRHADQRLEVRGEGCRSPSCSVTLQRHFDSHSYGVD